MFSPTRALNGVFPAARQTPVRLKLLFSGPSQTDTAFNARQMGPHLRKPGNRVLELGEFYLQFGLLAPGPRREYIQYEFGAVNDLQPRCLLEISYLRRFQIVVEYYDIRVARRAYQLEFADLSFTKAVCRVG